MAPSQIGEKFERRIQKILISLSYCQFPQEKRDLSLFNPIRFYPYLSTSLTFRFTNFLYP
jgi:hypothetical protein